MHRLFQFSPPRGGRPFRFISATPKSIFQFSPPRGGRLHGVVIVFGHLLISILAPARGATDITTSKVVRFQFQFPPPHGGRRERPMDWKQTILFQFPPPHGGRQFACRCRTRFAHISIPAPARGATTHPPLDSYVLTISIPAPARGATLLISSAISGTTLFQFPPPHGGRQISVSLRGPLQNFNSRPRTGGDISVGVGVAGDPISIPAPARGATLWSVHSVSCDLISIPAPARGATLPRANIQRSVFISIPAPARGATNPVTVAGRAINFNSRPRTGGDVFGLPLICRVVISIPAPARGATVISLGLAGSTAFQFPPPHGGRPSYILLRKT